MIMGHLKSRINILNRICDVLSHRRGIRVRRHGRNLSWRNKVNKSIDKNKIISNKNVGSNTQNSSKILCKKIK